jgi:preprotein translocase subunit SecE
MYLKQSNGMLQRATKFLGDVRTEMSKVSWPTWPQLKGQTIIVIVVAIIFAVYIFVIDHILSRLLDLIY